ncbi:MAG TPA: hypothetical protein VJ654_10945 [Noviherbaspirillum sp.]|nr:hypothetical protein [Noviherbaspirillum sp.]
MSMRELFDALGAALQDERWSWGGVREHDKRVFLCVWQDTIREIDGKRCVWVSDVEGADESLGAGERLKHLGLIRSGYAPYLVTCGTDERATQPTATKGIDGWKILVGGALLAREDGFWLEVTNLAPLRDVTARP